MTRKKIFLALFVSLISTAEATEQTIRPPPDPPPDREHVEYEIVIPKLVIGFSSPSGLNVTLDAILFYDKKGNNLILSTYSNREVLQYLTKINPDHKVASGAGSTHIYLDFDPGQDPIEVVARAGFRVIDRSK